MKKIKELLNKFINIKFIANIRQWVKKHPKIAWSILVGILLIIAGINTVLILSKKPSEKISTPIPIVEPVVDAVKYYSPLTGNLVDSEAKTKLAVTGVMIENSQDARPQSGLKDSGVIFEAIAEGGITRFMVLYQQEKPKLVGPVRSLRLYDIDWLAAFNAGIAHVGGSAAALREIRNGSHRDLDQFFNPRTYWRAKDRYAPHDVYTSFDNLDALNNSKGFTSSSFTGFTRTDGAPSDLPDATTINITVSSPLFNSSYVYDKTTNTYARSQAGKPHTDREGGQITPSVVIAMRVNETTVLEDGYRQKIDTIGSGDATIFQNGIATKVTWRKLSVMDQITFTDANGKDVPLVRGQTWITAVPNDKGDVVYN